MGALRILFLVLRVIISGSLFCQGLIRFSRVSLHNSSHSGSATSSRSLHSVGARWGSCFCILILGEMSVRCSKYQGRTSKQISISPRESPSHHLLPGASLSTVLHRDVIRSPKQLTFSSGCCLHNSWRQIVTAQPVLQLIGCGRFSLRPLRCQEVKLKAYSRSVRVL